MGHHPHWFCGYVEAKAFCEPVEQQTEGDGAGGDGSNVDYCGFSAEYREDCSEGGGVCSGSCH